MTVVVRKITVYLETNLQLTNHSQATKIKSDIQSDQAWSRDCLVCFSLQTVPSDVLKGARTTSVPLSGDLFISFLSFGAVIMVDLKLSNIQGVSKKGNHLRNKIMYSFQNSKDLKGIHN